MAKLAFFYASAISSCCLRRSSFSSASRDFYLLSAFSLILLLSVLVLLLEPDRVRSTCSATLAALSCFILRSASSYLANSSRFSRLCRTMSDSPVFPKLLLLALAYFWKSSYLATFCFGVVIAGSTFVCFGCSTLIGAALISFTCTFCFFSSSFACLY